MRDVTLQVKSRQKTTGEEPEVVDFMTEGKLYFKENATYLVYEESELSGMPNHTTTLKITDHAVDMKRFGDHPTHMYFEKGKRHVTDYETEYGTFKIEMLTHVLTMQLGDLEGSISIEYAISIQNMHEAVHHLTILYK